MDAQRCGNNVASRLHLSQIFGRSTSTMFNSFFQVAFITNNFSLDMKHFSIDIPNDLDGLHTACKQRNSMCGLHTWAATNLVSVLSSTKHTLQ